MSVVTGRSVGAAPDSRSDQTKTVQGVRVLRFTGTSAEFSPDHVVVEEPLTVRLRLRGMDVTLGSTMRTPGHDLELAVGLAVAEGVLRDLNDLSSIRRCRPGSRGSKNDVVIDLDDGVVVDASRLGRVSHPSSACGMCGRDQIDELMSRVPAIRAGVMIDAEVLGGLPAAMSGKQAVFRRTGGLHAAALANRAGEILFVREDVGRHNAVDKVVGRGLLDGVVADVLVVSGRAGFEIVQKAAMAGIPIVASVSAPTSLSVDAARQAGITLAAFVRGDCMTVYSGTHRLNGVPGIDAPSSDIT